MKHFLKLTTRQVITLFMPILPNNVVGKTLALAKSALYCLLFAWSSISIAGTQHFEAPLDSVKWVVSSAKLHCSLVHDIPLYGNAKFAQAAGEKLRFTLAVKNKATRNKDRARLRSIPPDWKHQVSVVDLGEVSIHKGGTPFQLEEALPRRMLAELQKGMFPTFSYRDWADARDQVSIALPGVHIKEALDEFITCLSQLPIYKFSDYRLSLMHFPFGKHQLTPKDQKRLDDIVRYVKSDEEVKRIDINGHTDNIGRKRSNDKLGRQRSSAVKDYLIRQGIDANKFQLKSFGERKPTTSNRTDKGRAENRRASITLIK